MKRSYSILRPALLYLVLSVARSAVAADVDLDWNGERQTIDGFGASGAFNKAGSTYRIPDAAVREKLLDLMFTRDKGIGLSIWRNIVGDGGVNYSNWGNDYDGSADTIWPDRDGGFVWSRTDWSDKKASFDKYQIWLMKEALERNPDLVIMSTVWSPPHWMKTNNSVMGNDARAVANGQPTNAGRLKPENYQDFADYLAEYVLGYQREFGINIRYISIANEPSLNSAYAHAAWSNNELNTFVRDYLGPTFAAKHVPAKVMMPEHLAFSETNLITTALNDPATMNYIDVIGTHAYGVSITADAITATFPTTKARGKGLWQTEYMSQPSSENNTFENNLVGDGLKFSKIMSDMMNFAEINAYLCWWAVANNGADGSDLIRLVNDGRPQGSAEANFSGTETGEYRTFKRFYTFGQFSRFIRPGYVRLNATDYRPRQDVRISAFKDPASGSFAIVAINQGAQAQTITLGLNDFPEVSAVIPYRTSDTENQRKLSAVAIAGGELTLNLTPASVSTYLSADDELPDFNAASDLYSILEAEKAERSAGVMIAALPGGGAALTGIRSNDFVVFPDINFADGTVNGNAAFRGVLSMHAKVAATRGGAIDVRVDAPHGPVVGHIDIRADFPGWAKLSTPIDTSMGNAHGDRDLYLVFDGESGATFNLDTIRFDQGRLAPAPTAELVVNGDAETTAPLTWTRQGPAPGAVSINTSLAHGGAASVRIAGRTNPAVGIGQSMTSKLDDRYAFDLSAWVQPLATDDVINAVLTITRNGMQNLVYPIGSVQAPAGAWTELAAQFSVPVPISQINAGGLNLYFTSGGTGDFHIDDVSVKLSAAPAEVATPDALTQLQAIAERVLALGLNHSAEVRLVHDLDKSIEFLGKKNRDQARKFIGHFLRDLDQMTGKKPELEDASADLLRELASAVLLVI